MSDDTLKKQIEQLSDQAAGACRAGDYAQARRLLREGYSLCGDADYTWGKGKILIRAGICLEDEKVYVLAAQCLYAAWMLFRALHDISAITARDILRGIEEDYGVKEAQYMGKGTPDSLLEAYFSMA